MSFQKCWAILLLVAGLALGLHAKDVKYVIYFIGDGMGPNQVEMAKIANGGKLNMLTLPVAGQLITHNGEGSTTDSAAAGTALACGVKTRNGVLGKDMADEAVQSVAEAAKAEGWRVGVLTTVNPNHATPAAFYAKVGGRGEVDTITDFMIPANFNLYGGAPLLASSDDVRAQKVADLNKAGYKTVKSADEIRALGVQDKAIWETTVQYIFEGRKAELPEVVDAAIEFLGKNDSPFFLMVEGGKIDYACHANNATAAIKELLEFDAAIGKAIEFAEKHPDETLLIVTADHETGGLQLDKDKFAAVDSAAVQEWLKNNGANVNTADWGIAYTTNGHSNANVPLRAIGPESEKLKPFQENTEVAELIFEVID